jgi:hypothetical protein
MKTWNQFLESKQMEAEVPFQSQRKSATFAPEDAQRYNAQQAKQPPFQSQRKSATLNLTPAQRAQGAQAPAAAAQQTPVSDEDMGQNYAKSMQIQQDMAQAKMRRRV